MADRPDVALNHHTRSNPKSRIHDRIAAGACTCGARLWHSERGAEPVLQWLVTNLSTLVRRGVFAIVISTLTEERRRKLAHNQALFREVNDRIHELAGAMRGWHTKFEIVCECSDETCTEFMSVAIGDYQPVREHAARFLIRPGHEIPEIERVVSQSAEYVVVEKFGSAAAVVARARQQQQSRRRVIA